MTYCELCKRETRNDEWRQHIISPKHLEFEEKNYCKFCKTKYDLSEYLGKFQIKCSSAEHNHKRTNAHKENQERLGFYST